MSNVRKDDKKFKRIAFEKNDVKVFVYFSEDISASPEVINSVGSAIKNPLLDHDLTGIETIIDRKPVISYLVHQIDSDQKISIFDLNNPVKNLFLKNDFKTISSEDLDLIVGSVQTIPMQKNAAKVEVTVDQALLSSDFLSPDILSAEAFFKDERVKNKIEEKNNPSLMQRIQGSLFGSQESLPAYNSSEIKFQDLSNSSSPKSANFPKFEAGAKGSRANSPTSPSPIQPSSGNSSPETSSLIQSNSRNHSPTGTVPEKQSISSSSGEQTQKASTNEGHKREKPKKKTIRNIDLGGTPGSKTKSPDQAASHSPSKAGIVLGGVDAKNNLEKLNTIKKTLIGFFNIPIESQNIQTMSLNKMMSLADSSSEFFNPSNLERLNLELKRISRNFMLSKSTSTGLRHYFSKAVYELEADVATPIEKAVYEYPHVQYLVDAFMDALYDSIWNQFSQFSDIFNKENEKNQAIEKMLIASAKWIQSAISDLNMSPTNNILKDNPFAYLNNLKNRLNIILSQKNISEALTDIDKRVSEFDANADLKAKIKSQFELKLGIADFLEIKNDVMGVSDQYKKIENDSSEISKIVEQVKEKLKLDSERHELEKKIKNLKVIFSEEKLESTTLYKMLSPFVNNLSVDKLTNEDREKLNHLFGAFKNGVDVAIEKNNGLDLKKTAIEKAFNQQRQGIKFLIDQMSENNLVISDDQVKKAREKISAIEEKILQYKMDYPKKINYLNQIEIDFDLSVQSFLLEINNEISLEMEEVKKADALKILQGIRNELEKDKPNVDDINSRILGYKKIVPNGKIDNSFKIVLESLKKKQTAIRQQTSAVSYYENGVRKIYSFNDEIKNLTEIHAEISKVVNAAMAAMEKNSQVVQVVHRSHFTLKEIQGVNNKIQDKVSSIFKKSERKVLNKIHPDLLLLSKKYDAAILSLFQKGSDYDLFISKKEEQVKTSTTIKGIETLVSVVGNEVKLQDQFLSAVGQFRNVFHEYLELLSEAKIVNGKTDDNFIKEIDSAIEEIKGKGTVQLKLDKVKELTQKVNEKIKEQFNSIQLKWKNEAISNLLSFKNLVVDFQNIKNLNEKYRFNLNLKGFNLLEENQDLEFKFNGISLSEAIQKLYLKDSQLSLENRKKYEEVITETRLFFLNLDGVASPFSQLQERVENAKKSISLLYQSKVNDLAERIKSDEKEIGIKSRDIASLKEEDLNDRFPVLFKGRKKTYQEDEKNLKAFLSECKEKLQNEQWKGGFELDLNLMDEVLSKEGSELKSKLEDSYKSIKEVFSWSSDFVQVLNWVDRFKNLFLSNIDNFYSGLDFKKLHDEIEVICLTESHNKELSQAYQFSRRLLSESKNQISLKVESFNNIKDQILNDSDAQKSISMLYQELLNIKNDFIDHANQAHSEMKHMLENFSSVKGYVDSISQLINELENQINANLKDLQFLSEGSEKGIFLNQSIGDNVRDKKMLLDYRAKLEGLKNLQKSDERLSGLISELKTEIQKRKEGFIDFGQYNFLEFKNKILGKINTFLTLLDASISKMNANSFSDSDYLSIKNAFLELGFAEGMIPMAFSSVSLSSIRTSINLTLFDFSRPSIQKVSDFGGWVTEFNKKEKAIRMDLENILKPIIQKEKAVYVSSLEILMKKMDANPKWSVADLNQAVLNTNLGNSLTIKEEKTSNYFYVFSPEENRIFKRMLNRLIELAKTHISFLDYEKAIEKEGADFSNDHLERIKKCSLAITALKPMKQENLVQGKTVVTEIQNSSGEALHAQSPEGKLKAVINQILTLLEIQEWKSQVHEFMGLFGGARFKANSLEYKVPNSVAKIHHDLTSIKDKSFDEQVKMILKIGQFAVAEKNRSPRIWRSKGFFAGYEDIRSTKTKTMLDTLSELNQGFIAAAIKGEEGKQGENISKLHKFLSNIATLGNKLKAVNSFDSAGDKTNKTGKSQKP